MAAPTRRAEKWVRSAWARFAIEGRLGATGKAARKIKQDFWRPCSASSGKRAGDRRATMRRCQLTPMRGEPDADAMSAANPRRHVGQGAVTFAVRRLGNWATA